RPKNTTRRNSKHLQPVDSSAAAAPRRRAGPAPWRSLVHHYRGSSYQSKLVLFFQNRGRLVSGNPGHLPRCLYWLGYLSDLRLRPAFPRRARPATRFVPARLRSFDATIGRFGEPKIQRSGFRSCVLVIATLAQSRICEVGVRVIISERSRSNRGENLAGRMRG